MRRRGRGYQLREVGGRNCKKQEEVRKELCTEDGRDMKEGFFVGIGYRDRKEGRREGRNRGRDGD